MAKPKTIMDMTPQELLKMFVKEVGALIKAENKTQETILRAELASKQDIARLEQKLDKKTEEHEDRLETIEEKVSLSRPPKN